jgi:hypothetical protein
MRRQIFHSLRKIFSEASSERGGLRRAFESNRNETGNERADRALLSRARSAGEANAPMIGTFECGS